MTLQEAADQARSSEHGSRNHFDAMEVLSKAYMDAHNTRPSYPTLKDLWDWVDTQVESIFLVWGRRSRNRHGHWAP